MQTLTYTCDVCGKKITRNGYIAIDKREAFDYPKIRTMARAQGIADGTIQEIGNGWEMSHGSALLDMPQKPCWRIFHAGRCDSNRDNPHEYSIPLSRASTPADLLHWVAHLGNKKWFDNTAWPQLVNRILSENGYWK